jgi:hypothetical protein
MIGRKVKHISTGEIKTISKYSMSGNVTFTDGSRGDIHYDGSPLRQTDKEWQYCNDDQVRLFDQEKIELFKSGKAAIRFSNYSDMSDSDFFSEVSIILSETGTTDFCTAYRWKYIYIEDGRVKTDDTASDIPKSCRGRIEYSDFYQTDSKIEINNYQIY